MLRTLRHTMLPALTALLAVLAAGAPAAAQSTATTYFGYSADGTQNDAVRTARTSFLNALTEGVGTETFEGLLSGARNPTLTFPGAGTATLTGSGSVSRSPNSGAGPVSGTSYYLVSTGSGSSPTFSITFANPIAAFGFYGRDLGDNYSNLILRFTSATGSTMNVQVPYDASRTALPNANLMFFGLLDAENTFTKVDFLSTASADVFGFDDMTIASAKQVTSTVPEPSTYLLLASGLGALGVVARRRQRA